MPTALTSRTAEGQTQAEPARAHCDCRWLPILHVLGLLPHLEALSAQFPRGFSHCAHLGPPPTQDEAQQLSRGCCEAVLGCGHQRLQTGYADGLALK